MILTPLLCAPYSNYRIRKVALEVCGKSLIASAANSMEDLQHVLKSRGLVRRTKDWYLREYEGYQIFGPRVAFIGTALLSRATRSEEKTYLEEWLPMMEEAFQDNEDHIVWVSHIELSEVWDLRGEWIILSNSYVGNKVVTEDTTLFLCEKTSGREDRISLCPRLAEFREVDSRQLEECISADLFRELRYTNYSHTDRTIDALMHCVSSLQDAKKQMRELLSEEEGGPKELGTFGLEFCPPIKVVRESPGSMEVEVDYEVTLRGWNFGKPRIIFSRGSARPRISLNPAEGDVYHPHINSDYPCYGQFEDPIRKALLEEDLGEAIALILTFLESYNPDDAYRRLPERGNDEQE